MPRRSGSNVAATTFRSSASFSRIRRCIVEYLFIENVGNLVCPAVYDLGQARNVVALSVTEGEDKPLKYPTMFAKADLVLLTKVDLMPYLGISLDAILDSLARAMPVPNVIALSTRGGLGVDDWLGWRERNRAMTFEEVMA